MGWDRIAEHRIRHLRVAFSILKSANCVPAEVELLLAVVLERGRRT